MKMTDLLEKDKDRLLTELSAAASAEKAIHVLENEIDKLLLKHNEQCETDRERESAAYMMQAVRLSLPLIDSNGKIKVWESGHTSETDTGGSFKPSFLVLLIVGLALCVFGFGPLMMDAYTAAASNARDQVLLHGGATLVGLIALYFSGYLYGCPKKVKDKKEYQVDIRIDADRIYRCFRTALLSVDQSLEEINAAERWKARERPAALKAGLSRSPSWISSLTFSLRHTAAIRSTLSKKLSR